MSAVMLFRPLLWALAAFGLSALALGALLAVPLTRPPELASIHADARAIGEDGLPPLNQFQARDGTWLGYRLYPAAQGAADRLAILVHGSAGNSRTMNAVGRALAEANIAAVAIDTRGHGTSGTRGDIGYLGQLDDDLADLIAAVRPQFPAAKLVLVGHSAGGGFALRIASQPLGRAFDHVVLLSPYLGHTAPTNRPATGTGRWAEADVPRYVALTVLHHLGLEWAESLPVIAFALPAAAVKGATLGYSYRLLRNFGPPPDWQAAFAGLQAPTEIIVGADDELMDAPHYRDVSPTVPVRVLAGVNHMGMVYRPAALAAIVAAVKP